MEDGLLGLELMDLYRRLRETADPAVKAVIRRRIDSRLGQAERIAEMARRAYRPAAGAYETGAD